MKGLPDIGERVMWYQMFIGGELATRAPTRAGTVVEIIPPGRWANTHSDQAGLIVESADGCKEIISARQLAA